MRRVAGGAISDSPSRRVAERWWSGWGTLPDLRPRERPLDRLQDRLRVGELGEREIDLGARELLAGERAQHRGVEADGQRQAARVGEAAGADGAREIPPGHLGHV